MAALPTFKINAAPNTGTLQPDGCRVPDSEC